jgi:hypothetical protein
MSGLFAQNTTITPEGVNAPGTNPLWIENQRKRTIPNHLVPKKKPGFHISTATTSNTSLANAQSGSNPSLVSSDQYNILSFGTQRRKTGTGIIDKSGIFESSSMDVTKYDDTINDSIYDDNMANTMADDLPPPRSIHDLNDEILNGLNKPVQMDSFLNKDPKLFANVFNKDTDTTVTKVAVDDVVKPLANNESAILVFGYPETIASQVIQHFKEFGDILENLETTAQSNSLLSITKERNHRIVPIFSGKNWIKLTFDNPESAVDALQENGIVFNGSILGVIPYSKDAIEKLQKRKLTVDEDIGGKTNLNVVHKPEEKSSAQLNTNNSIVTKLDIKDGSKFFLKSEGELKAEEEKKKSNVKMSLLGTVSKWLFGFHEL